MEMERLLEKDREFGNRHKHIRNFVCDNDGTPTGGVTTGVPSGKTKLDPCLTLCMKINFKWINCFKCEILKKNKN